LSIAAKEGYDILINQVNATFCSRETVAYEAARYIKQRRPKDLVETCSRDGCADCDPWGLAHDGAFVEGPKSVGGANQRALRIDLGIVGVGIGQRLLE
jgi:hypothetical protein